MNASEDVSVTLSQKSIVFLDWLIFLFILFLFYFMLLLKSPF